MQPTLVTTDMRYWRISPDARLRGIVSCYWAVDTLPVSARIQAQEPVEDLLIPDGLSEIVFNRGGPGFDRWELGQPEAKRHMRGSYLIGGRSRSVNTHAPEPLRLAGVKLDPRFLRTIIRVPLSEFRDATLPLAELGDSRLLALEDALAQARGVETLAGLLDEFFLAALRDLRRPRNQLDARPRISFDALPRISFDALPRNPVDALVARIHEDHGATPILFWADRAGVDARGLERAFCADLGMTPKQYARVIRFRRHYASLISGGQARRPLSANLDGFFDQSHFNREFRHFTGVAPSTKLAGRMTQGMKVADHLLQG